MKYPISDTTMPSAKGGMSKVRMPLMLGSIIAGKHFGSELSQDVFIRMPC